MRPDAGIPPAAANGGLSGPGGPPMKKAFGRVVRGGRRLFVASRSLNRIMTYNETPPDSPAVLIPYQNLVRGTI